MVCNVIYDNNLDISWMEGLLLKATGVPGENNLHAVSHWQTLSTKIVSSV